MAPKAAILLLAFLGAVLCQHYVVANEVTTTNVGGSGNSTSSVVASLNEEIDLEAIAANVSGFDRTEANDDTDTSGEVEVADVNGEGEEEADQLPALALARILTERSSRNCWSENHCKKFFSKPGCCKKKCVNLASDDRNCGTCGKCCNTKKGYSCQSGKCCKAARKQHSKPHKPSHSHKSHKPSHSHKSRKPSHPHQPHKPSHPHQPYKPSHPHQSQKPSQPQQPHKPSHPHQPHKPSHPHQPHKPSHSHQPHKPSHPHKPHKPSHPHQPHKPSHPHQPHKPSHPHQPHKPSHPHKPHKPSHPHKPHHNSMQCGYHEKCKKNYTCCKGMCVNLRSNSAHCGKCNKGCRYGSACSKGMCANLHHDNSNCGKTGRRCGYGHKCCTGSCKNVFGNDKNNCGACGKKCATSCSYGMCGYGL